MIDVQGVDFIRVPVTDIEEAKRFYGEVLGLPDGPTQHEDWVEYQAGNVTLAVMTPETHDEEFAPLAPGSFAFGVPDVAAANFSPSGTTDPRCRSSSSGCDSTACARLVKSAPPASP